MTEVKAGDILVDSEGETFIVMALSSKGDPVVRSAGGNAITLDKDLRCYHGDGGQYKKISLWWLEYGLMTGLIKSP